MIFDNFKDKKVLVTGHTGFKGSWLALWLKEFGAEVYGYSLPPDTVPSHYEKAKIREILEGECLGDIREKEKFASYIHDVQPDCIFHLAAQSLVRRSYLEPVETFDVNVMGSIHLMEAVRALGKPCSIVMITSDKCYLNVNQVWGYRECDKLGGHDPYSASKAAAEIAIASFRDSFFSSDKISNHGVSLASARAGNVIGGGDWAEDRIIPDAVRAVTSEKPLEIRSPQAVRPWQHVLEPLSGYMLIAAKMMMVSSESPVPLAGAWNFGPLPTGSATVLDIINGFYNAWGKGEANYDPSLANLHEAAILRLSCEKAISGLGWKPVWDLEDTLKITAEWYRNYYDGEDARELSLADIKQYMKKMVKYE